MALLSPSVQSLSCVQLFATPWIAARQASLSITSFQSSLRLTRIESVMPSSHLILCHPLLLPPSMFPSIRVFSSESALRIRWPKYWSFSFSTSPSNEYSRLISFRIDRLDLLAGSQVSNLPKRTAAPWRDKKLSWGTDGPPWGVGRMQKEQRTTGTPGPGSKSREWCHPF